MTESECLSYRSTSYFSKLICDYLDQHKSLNQFYHRFPSLENFNDQIQEKQKAFNLDKRKLLVKSLNNQYNNILGGINEGSLVAENIKALEQENSFTLVTGHQLNILTGPLYFIYKIVSTLNLSKQLKEQYPDKNFVPIFWMATEDHDFEEVNFINFYGGKLRWKSSTKGAVGQMPTFGFGKVLDTLEHNLGKGEKAKQLLQIFRKGYHDHKNMADATRYITHQLFKDEGLVIVDGDDAGLKRCMIPYFEKDLVEGVSNQYVTKTSEELSKEYFAQVYPREINLFYLKPGFRERIEKQGDKWSVLNSDIAFTKAELLKELQAHPERFSPNVVLRPLYQEVVLPNLAYIGGGGEIAYWLQLKNMFGAYHIPFPMLTLRNSVLWVNEKWQNRIEDLDLDVSDFFQNLEGLKNKLALQYTPFDPKLTKQEQSLEKMFLELGDLAQQTDKSMIGAVNAQRQKQLKGLKNLRKKLLRAEKRRHIVELEKAERIHKALFPNGGLQERYDNLSVFYAAYGEDFIATLKKCLHPLDFKFTVINA